MQNAKCKTFLFVGRSGCGKGTQVALLEKVLRAQGGKEILSFSSGAGFRELMTKEGYTPGLVRELVGNGRFAPRFLAVRIWANSFVEQLSREETLILDGAGRRLGEAEMLSEALGFYGRERVEIILIDVSRKWATERLLGRGRADDTPERIASRLDEFEKYTLDSLKHFSAQPGWVTHTINGEQTIEQVHSDIMSAIG